MKKLFIGLITIALCACSPINTAAHLAGLSTPTAVADKVVLDEKAGIAVESMYVAIVKAGALAFRAGFIAPSTNPIVRQSDFCSLVLAGSFTVTDLGSRVNTLECQLRAARDLTRLAYDAGNAATYDKAARDAVSIGKTLLALLGSH